MKHGQKISNIFAFTAAGVMMYGCGSITFFPTAPALKAADKVIDDIWPAQPVQPAQIKAPTAPLKSVTALPPAPDVKREAN